ncbi:ribosomal protein S6 kinase 2 beta [Exaiptasia diaphana]|uniref:Protein kinase domain-containing protein n=1 Tax=Exaiptasia diaphana TaxID=2652724 RepID=A0A913XKF7_EXADI|nr:ribosomal protein S6 kinase 2 beta [Exaiptasia diaphana]
MDKAVYYPRSKERLSLRRKKLRKKILEKRKFKVTESHHVPNKETQEEITEAEETSITSKPAKNDEKKAVIESSQFGRSTIVDNSHLLASTYAGRVLLAARPELKPSSKGKKTIVVNKPPIIPKKKTTTTILNPNLLKDYGNEKEALLGEGRFGIVRLMQYRSTLVAVKMSKERKYSYLIEYEGQILCNLGDHPGFPYCYGLCEKDGTKLLVMEFCSVNGKSISLNYALKSKLISDEFWPKILYTLAGSIGYMHAQGYIHCDIHGNNILVMQRSST